MMARQVARQFCRLGEVHSLVYGRRASGENGRKPTASTRVGSKSRLTDYLGLMQPKRDKASGRAAFSGSSRGSPQNAAGGARELEWEAAGDVATAIMD
jgi:hypothetical protein